MQKLSPKNFPFLLSASSHPFLLHQQPQLLPVNSVPRYDPSDAYNPHGRGLCVIVNNKTFYKDDKEAKSGLGERKGTEMDEVSDDSLVLTCLSFRSNFRSCICNNFNGLFRNYSVHSLYPSSVIKTLSIGTFPTLKFNGLSFSDSFLHQNQPVFLSYSPSLS